MCNYKMTKSRTRSRTRSRQLRGGHPAITYPLALMVGLGVLYYLKKKGSQLGERLEAKGDRAIEEAQANVAALARRAGDDLIKRDREKLRLKISRLNRELDPEDQIDGVDTRAWNCDLKGDPIFCLNEIIQEIENIALAAEERKRQGFKDDYVAANVDEKFVQDILDRKMRIEAGATPSGERSPYMHAAVQAAQANRTRPNKKTKLKNILRTRRGGRTIRKRNRRGRTRRRTRTRRR